jgi:hypothetical protein
MTNKTQKKKKNRHFHWLAIGSQWKSQVNKKKAWKRQTIFHSTPSTTTALFTTLLAFTCGW